MLKRLKEAGLPIDIDKIEFYIQKTKFLSFIINIKGIKVNPEKLKAIIK